ncbi:neurotrimin-like isoform X2 [Vespula squamosa]|uniref:Neurotrimin-like isoform X2 n=1 Tax=Vespula squamosa TaxID=30214 RepID=A0ABD1ZXP0_VESSQ
MDTETINAKNYQRKIKNIVAIAREATMKSSFCTAKIRSKNSRNRSSSFANYKFSDRSLINNYRELESVHHRRGSRPTSMSTNLIFNQLRIIHPQFRPKSRTSVLEPSQNFLSDSIKIIISIKSSFTSKSSHKFFTYRLNLRVRCGNCGIIESALNQYAREDKTNVQRNVSRYDIAIVETTRTALNKSAYEVETSTSLPRVTGKNICLN